MVVVVVEVEVAVAMEAEAVGGTVMVVGTMRAVGVRRPLGNPSHRTMSRRHPHPCMTHLLAQWRGHPIT